MEEIFEIGDKVRFKVQEWDRPKVIDIRLAIERGTLGNGIFTVMNTRPYPEGSGVGHSQMLLVRNSNGTEQIWSGWWFEKVT